LEDEDAWEAFYTGVISKLVDRCGLSTTRHEPLALFNALISRVTRYINPN